MAEPQTYRDLAERAWTWARSQVRENDAGLWIPQDPASETEPGPYVYGMYAGIGGLAYALAEIRLARDLTSEEQRLADGIAETLVRRIPEQTEYDIFEGCASTIGVLVALGADGVDLAMARLLELAGPDGWQPSWLEDEWATPDARCNDLTLGTAGVLLGALWGLMNDVPRAAELADHATGILLAEQEPRDAGVYWPFVPLRFLRRDDVRMPNWSHGQAGVAGTLAAAGIVLDRPDLVELAGRGAAYLLSLGDTTDGGLRVPTRIPGTEDVETFTYSWCHGPTGTSLLFAALDRAGADAVAGRSPHDWERACVHSLKVSGIPERRHPGFWDNDGRCCGTAGVGDVVLNIWQRHGVDDDLALAVRLGDALVERAITDGDDVYWRFIEHRNDEPLLPAQPGWMQGAAGIATYLFRLARVLDQGRGAQTVARMDTWWALP